MSLITDIRQVTHHITQKKITENENIVANIITKIGADHEGVTAIKANKILFIAKTYMILHKNIYDVIHSNAHWWRGDESLTGSKTVARYQRDIIGTRETQSVLPWGVCPLKPINGKIVQTILWKLRSVLIKLFKSLTDQLIVPMKRGNACRAKGLAVEPLGPGHIYRTNRRVKDGNKTGLITYLVNGRNVLLKGRIRENLKFGSVRGLIAASRRWWL